MNRLLHALLSSSIRAIYLRCREQMDVQPPAGMQDAHTSTSLQVIWGRKSVTLFCHDASREARREQWREGEKLREPRMAGSGHIDRLCARLQSNKVQLVQKKKLKIKSDVEDKHEQPLHATPAYLGNPPFSPAAQSILIQLVDGCPQS
jgi:hypothetical protein